MRYTSLKVYISKSQDGIAVIVGYPLGPGWRERAEEVAQGGIDAALQAVPTGKRRPGTAGVLGRAWAYMAIPTSHQQAPSIADLIQQAADAARAWAAQWAVEHRDVTVYFT